MKEGSRLNLLEQTRSSFRITQRKKPPFLKNRLPGIPFIPYACGFVIRSTPLQLWKHFSVLSLAACFLLFSMGARSIGFHQWFHGEHVHCSLVFEAGHEHHDQDHSEEDQPVGEDPLSPFCESGSLDLTSSSAFLLLPPCIEVMPTFLHDAPELTWTRSASPRAPPAWV